MKKHRLAALLTVLALVLGLLSGCGNQKAEEAEIKEDEKVSEPETEQEQEQVNENVKEEPTEEDITLNYWTWFPSQEQLQETIDQFEQENPGIHINMTVMEGLTYQQKVPLALQTGEDIDVIGVQPSDFAKTIQDYLVDLEEFMPSVVGEDWLDGYSMETLEKGKKLTEGKAKFITILNSGCMVGFYNAALLNELEMEVPATIDEFKNVADALYEKHPDKYAAVFPGMESWVCSELMLTILTQQGDYYNQWLYENAPFTTGEYQQALEGVKKYFDLGIFKQDVMDLDAANAMATFANGDALVYFFGSWEAPILSSTLREKNGIPLEDVGVMPLPVVEPDGRATLRAYMDCGVGIVESSEKKEAAAKFVQYLATGNGVNLLAKQFLGTPGMESCEVDPSLLTSEAAQNGWNTLVDLMNHAGADRNNRTSWLPTIEGPTVQSVINGSVTPEEAVETLQREWDTGNY